MTAADYATAAPMWISVAVTLVAVAAAVTCAVGAFLASRALGELRAIVRAERQLPAAAAAAAPPPDEDPATVTLERIRPPGARPYLAAPPRPGRHAAARP